MTTIEEVILATDGHPTTDSCAAFADLNDEGNREFDALWNTAGSRVQPVVDQVREVA